MRTSDRIEFQILARIVKKHREKAKISQRALSQMIGRSDSYIGKFESGDAYPDFATALDMLQALGLDVGETVNEILAEAKKKRR